MELDGKTALVTGGSRDIDRAIVRALASAGAKVTFVYRSNSEAATNFVSEHELEGREAVAVTAVCVLDAS